jgi:hypothetical protein
MNNAAWLPNNCAHHHHHQITKLSHSINAKRTTVLKAWATLDSLLGWQGPLYNLSILATCCVSFASAGTLALLPDVLHST